MTYFRRHRDRIHLRTSLDPATHVARQLFAGRPREIREFMRTKARTSALAWPMALLLGAGCGGGTTTPQGATNNSNGNATSGAEAQQCDLRAETIARWTPTHIDGSRILVPLPEEARLAEGNTIFVIPSCMSFVATVEAPPAMVSDPTFISSNMADLQSTRSCQESAGGLVCQEERGVLVARPLRTQGAVAVIMASGPSAEEVNHLLDAMRFDTTLPFDPVHALGLNQPAPEGMALHPLSQAHMLIYTPPSANPDVAETATLLWAYETGTDREIGEQLGRMAVQRLGVSQLGQVSPIGEATEREMVLGADAMHGTSPVTVVMGLFRQQTGAFVFIARVPRADAEAWIQRFHVQVAATEILR